MLRIAAALVLAPLGIVLAYAGGWWWAALVTLAAIGLFVEWLAMTSATRKLPGTVTGVIALVLIAPCRVLGNGNAALVVLARGRVAVSFRASEPRVWAIAAFLYAAAAQVAAIAVRLDKEQGFSAIMLVLLVVWATDIGGYFAGRGIGGPKLWPRVSPNKTWAGAVGGFVASLLVAVGFAACGLGKMAPLLLVSAILSVVAALGNLFESEVKRRFGVKDSSHLIPGHGGLMDRLDGFVAAILMAWIIGFLRHGVHSAGSGLMVW